VGERYIRINVTIPRALKDELKKLVEEGKFTTISDCIREAIRLLLEKYKN